MADLLEARRQPSRRRRPCALYYYSSHERTTLAHLARKHPAVCSEDDCRAMRVLLDALRGLPVRRDP